MVKFLEDSECGELFAKRRKKADKWVVDEQNVGSTTSQFASQLVTSETHETSLIGGGYHRAGEEVDAAEAEQFRQEQQETFQQQQLAKQQQGLAMRQERSTMNGDQQSLELPPNFKPCSLKGRPFTPTFDLSCHNTQGIDVWKNKGPKPFALGASSTLPRNLGQARAGGQLPPNAAVVQSESSSKKVVSQEVTSSSVSSSHDQQVSSTTTTTSQQQQHQVVQQNSSSSVTAEAASSQQQSTVMTAMNNHDSKNLEEEKRMEYEQWLKQQQKEQQMMQYDCSVKYEESQSAVSSTATTQGATKTQDEVDRAAVEAQMIREQQELEKLKLEEEHRQMEQKRIEEERIRMEQEQRERELAEQKLREEEQRQREMEEQVRREEEERARREQQEREERERAERERQMREQQEREEQERRAREQQERERQMREQQEREEQERRAREQQERERQMREQQERERQEQMMREQQMREQQMREQQMKQQQMMQQTQKVQSQSTMSSTSTSFQQQTSSTLHKSELSMQMKSGGMMSGSLAQTEDYTGSLRPTTTGELIRQTGDVIFTQAGDHHPEMEQVELRPTSKGNVKDNIRQSGVFVGIVGDNNSLINEMQNFDYEKHSVRELVGHFSKGKGLVPQNMFPQHLAAANNAATPSLSQLQDQAKSKEFSYQKQTEQKSDKLQQEEAEEKLALLSERKNSLKSFMLMEDEIAKLNNQAGGQILDPSAILQVDGSLTNEISQARGSSRGRDLDSQGRLGGVDTDKWDNHNAIASGWKTVESNYRPVTFRKIYGVNKQMPPSVTPTPTSTLQRPAKQKETLPAENNIEPSTAACEELAADCSDL